MVISGDETDWRQSGGMNKRKLIAALVSLILCFVVLVSSSYAWLMLSLAPEITGVKTHIGANGGLEIALLGDETYVDPTLIRTGVGDSTVVQDSTVSNLSWGNVVDLTDPAYGLDRIVLVPARLNALGGADGSGVVRRNMLCVAQYGIDGRFTTLDTGAVSAVYDGNAFAYRVDRQSYGVRGIGTAGSMTAQQTALANARSMVKTYRSTALANTKAAWETYGAELLDICLRRYYLNNDSFTRADLTAIRDASVTMDSVLDAIDASLRQGIVGLAASELEDEEEFRTMAAVVESPLVPLSEVLKYLPDNLPEGFSKTINWLVQNQQMLTDSVEECNRLLSDPDPDIRYTYSQISDGLDLLINAHDCWLGDFRMDTSNAYGRMGQDNVLTAEAYAGVMAAVSNFCGNYNVFFAYKQINSVEVVTSSTESPDHLTTISAVLDMVKPALGDANVDSVNLTDTYGYLVDLGFRCNTTSNLLLQTTPALRVEEDGELVQTQGGGSYMRFSSNQLAPNQIGTLMAALRVGFMDNQGNLLAVAAISPEDFVVTEEGVDAPLYLQEFYVLPDGRLLITGRKDDAVIQALPEDTATVISVIVWLDGDCVTNGQAGITPQSMTGALNLQFASDANLKPSDLPIQDSDD